MFEAAYRKLNKGQRKAVDTIDGPVMVIAGPGTGKTTVLTLRIANILRLTDTPPDTILALTFTESGVYAMRKKLAEIIGSNAYRVSIATFHGFANDVIQNNPSSFPKIIGSRPATEIDQVRILESLIKKGKWEQIKPLGDVFYYVRPALEAIRNLKKEYYTPERFRRWFGSSEILKSADEKVKERNLELAKLFSLYEKSLRAQKLYDYEDMLIEAVKVLEKDRNLLLTVRENCQYILADEHQDSNGVQNRMLELLAGEEDRPDLFIVGDEKQAIYRFQGASLENFLYFKKRFPEAASIVLTESYRSHQDILDASHSLAERLPQSEFVSRPRLLSRGKTRPAPPSIEVLSFPDEEAEAAFVSRQIKAQSARGDLGHTAVFYRNNIHSAPLAEALAKEGIEFVVRSDEDVFADADIQNLVTLLRAALNPTDDENVAKFMLADFSNLDLIDCFKVFNEKRYKKIPIISVLKDKKWLKRAGVKNAGHFGEFADRIKKWTLAAHNEPLAEFLDRITSESGFKDKLITSDKGLSKLEKLHAFYELARSLSLANPWARLPDLVSYLDSASRFGVRIPGRSEELTERVELMTAHRAKGLEFDTVFITRATEENWGGRAGRKLFELPPEARSAAKSGEEEDERRLFYVSMTRARNKIFITHARARSDGKPLAPSRFIEDINERFLMRRDEKGIVHDVSIGRRIDGLGLKNISPKTRNYLKKLFLEQGLNVTALNNYLECPWQYFFRNLIRVPAAPERSQDFGSVIHGALKVFQNEVGAGKKPKFSRLLELFSLHLRQYGFSPEEYRIWEKRGKSALEVFFKSHKWSPEARSELKIDGIEFNFGGQKINLRGKIDSVIFSGDRADVVDFKTGRVKSRNEILGKTKSSNGAMFRQLVFYKLLLERMKKGLKVDAGAIEFVEPDAKGRYKKEVFSLSMEDRQAVEKEIARAAKEIYGLSFWKETCGKRDCEYCRLRKSLEFGA